MQYWIMKSEPDCFSIFDLAKKSTEPWDGVRNYQVRNMMRDQMQIGDRALFYHSSAGKETGVAGVMEIVASAYPDPTQFDPQSEHPDPASDPQNPRWLCVDVAHVKTFPRTITLAELKVPKALHRMKILQKGNRLSVTPITKSEYDTIVRLAKK